MLNRFFNISLSKKKKLIGWIFISPFLVGFTVFFLAPFIKSVLFSVSEIEVTSKGFTLDYIGFENYYEILFVHPDFLRVFLYSIGKTLINLPAILLFSFFIAVVINDKFRGRLLARVILFLPVIMGADIIMKIEQTDMLFNSLEQGAPAAQGMNTGMLGAGTAMIENLFIQMQLPDFLVNYVITAVEMLPEIIYASAIPILIFLAALQSIPSSLFEAAAIEGASGWERFWKITFPFVSSMFLPNIVYILVDSFTSPTNKLLVLIQDEGWGGGSGYSLSIAMSWIYFASIMLILVVFIALISRQVFYME